MGWPFFLAGAGYNANSWGLERQTPPHLSAVNGRPAAAKTVLALGTHISPDPEYPNDAMRNGFDKDVVTALETSLFISLVMKI